jgi:NAD(P)-dependent dehydrogenase (short-subunit alcohol dehydrogenase family)
MELKDKRALITGVTSGMGSAAALSMAEKGASVIITGRDETRGASTVETTRAGGHDAQFIAADLLEMLSRRTNDEPLWLERPVFGSGRSSTAVCR